MANNSCRICGAVFIVDDDDDTILYCLCDSLTDLEEMFAAVDENEYEVLAYLSDFDLLERYHLNNSALKEMGELYADNGNQFGSSTPEGRELQSKRAAYLIEIRQRGLPL